MTYTNKDVYSGNWSMGNKDGQGTYVFFSTSMKFVGTWKVGQIASGKWKYQNGTYFEGQFDNNKPRGKGKWVFQNGNTVEGEYNQFKRADVDGGDDIKIEWKTTSDITKPPVVAP